ncbi:hypothetical protein ACFXPN_41115 [Streptomyces griseorubiginosus]|uniref:hypothetical protein n=1 Tax=Streptomyces griseorubiginosus TaxID=67304 RepID=UPI003695C4EC
MTGGTDGLGETEAGASGALGERGRGGADGLGERETGSTGGLGERETSGTGGPGERETGTTDGPGEEGPHASEAAGNAEARGAVSPAGPDALADEAPGPAEPLTRADEIPAQARSAERAGELPAQAQSPEPADPVAPSVAPDTPTPPAPAPRAPEISTGRTPTPARRPAADPVKALMHRHRELCERAVDPLEIAAGLEAHGLTDRTAVRFRHRDVFSLAEEMYARVPRDGETPPPPTADKTPRSRADWALLALLPGALCAATVVGIRLTEGQPRLVIALVGALAVSFAVRAALSRGPLGTPDRAPTTTPSTWTYWLLAYAALGDGLLGAALTGGPDALPTGAADAPWPVATAPLLALTLSCAPAAWSAHLFKDRARRKLTASRGLEDFAASVRPLLLGTFALYLCALTALLALSATALDEPAPYAQTLTLGALLFLARVLTTHGFTHAPVVVLIAATTAEATTLAATFASRLPGCAFLATPVDALVNLWGPAGIQTLSCGIGALALLIHAIRKLTRASAHAKEEPC